MVKIEPANNSNTSNKLLADHPSPLETLNNNSNNSAHSCRKKFRIPHSNSKPNKYKSKKRHTGSHALVTLQPVSPTQTLIASHVGTAAKATGVSLKNNPARSLRQVSHPTTEKPVSSSKIIATSSESCSGYDSEIGSRESIFSRANTRSCHTSHSDLADTLSEADAQIEKVGFSPLNKASILTTDNPAVLTQKDDGLQDESPRIAAPGKNNQRPSLWQRLKAFFLKLFTRHTTEVLPEQSPLLSDKASSLETARSVQSTAQNPASTRVQSNEMTQSDAHTPLKFTPNSSKLSLWGWLKTFFWNPFTRSTANVLPAQALPAQSSQTAAPVLPEASS